MIARTENLFLREPSPEVRLAAWLIGVLGAVIAVDLALLLGGWLILLVSLVAAGQFRRHLPFLLIVLLPLALVLVAVWWGFVGAPPDMARGSAPTQGLLHAVRTTLRLGIIAALSQFAFLTIRPDTIWPAMRRLGLSGQPLSIALASLALGAGMTKVVDQTITTLKARGAIRPNQFSTRLRAMPILLINIWNRLLADQFQRVELKWAPQRTLDRVAKLEANVSWSTFHSVLTILPAGIWGAVCLLSRIYG